MEDQEIAYWKKAFEDAEKERQKYSDALYKILIHTYDNNIDRI